MAPATRIDQPSSGGDGVFFACAYSAERVRALRGVIRAAVEARGFSLEAPALQPGGGGLWRLISSQIEASSIGFYDYRDPNMNVAVEFGYALGRGKPAVIVSDDETFRALPRPLTAVLAVMCPDDDVLVDRMNEFLERPWPPGHYDWRDLRPTTARFEPARTESRIVVFGDDEDLMEKLVGADLAGYVVARISPEDARSPEGIFDLIRDADAALFITRGKAPAGDAVAKVGASHLVAGVCLARGVPIRVLHRADARVASDLVGEANEVTPDDVVAVATEFVRGLTMGTPVLSLRPRLEGAVLRRSLLDSLSPHRTLFLWAEPGYGKSVLLSQLVPQSAVWVTCSGRVSSGQILATVARELTRNLPGAGSTALHHAQRPDSDEVEWRDALLDDLNRAEGSPEIELVIDDAHHLSSKALRAISSLSQSPRVRLLIAGRRAPAFGEALAAAPHVLRAEDLAFSLEEAERLFAGADLEPHSLNELLARTEGWPYALALAREVVRLQGASGLATLSGGRREIAAVFEESILGAMTQAERSVVEAVALAWTLKLEEVEWVVGRSDATMTLADLADRPMFIVEYGDPVPAYRLHSLYREFVLKKLESSRGSEWLRQRRRELAQQFRQKQNYLGTLRVAEEGEAWDIATDAVKDMLPLADRFVARFLRERLDAFPASAWERDPVLLRFAIRHDFDWGRLQHAERLTSVLREINPHDPFVQYFEVWARLQRGGLTGDDLLLLDEIAEQMAAVDADASGAIRIARHELESRLQSRPTPEELASIADLLAAMGSDETYSRPLRGEACLQAGMTYSRAFFGAYVANMTRLRTRMDVLGNVGVEERTALAADTLKWQSRASALIAQAGSLLPIDEDPVARARYLQTVGVAQGNATLAMDRLGESDSDPALFETPIRLIAEAIELWRGLRIERAEVLALTEKAQPLFFASRIDEADSLITEAERRARDGGWPEIVARCAAVRTLRDIVLSWNDIPPIAALNDESIDNFARSVMENFDVPATEEHFANVRAEIVRLASVDREKYSHCRHIDLLEHRRGNSPHELLGREISACTIVCRLLGVEHPGGTGDVAEAIAAFKGRYCLGCPHREPLPATEQRADGGTRA